MNITVFCVELLALLAYRDVHVNFPHVWREEAQVSRCALFGKFCV